MELDATVAVQGRGSGANPIETSNNYGGSHRSSVW